MPIPTNNNANGYLRMNELRSVAMVANLFSRMEDPAVANSSPSAVTAPRALLISDFAKLVDLGLYIPNARGAVFIVILVKGGRLLPGPDRACIRISLLPGRSICFFVPRSIRNHHQ